MTIRARTLSLQSGATGAVGTLASPVAGTPAFSKVGGPSGWTIDPTTGVFSTDHATNGATETPVFKVQKTGGVASVAFPVQVTWAASSGASFPLIAKTPDTPFGPIPFTGTNGALATTAHARLASDSIGSGLSGFTILNNRMKAVAGSIGTVGIDTGASDSFVECDLVSGGYDIGYNLAATIRLDAKASDTYFESSFSLYGALQEAAIYVGGNRTVLQSYTGNAGLFDGCRIRAEAIGDSYVVYLNGSATPAFTWGRTASANRASLAGIGQNNGPSYSNQFTTVDNVTIGAIATGLNIVSTTLNSDRTVTTVIKYNGSGADTPSGYEYQIKGAGAWTAETLLANPSAGNATIKTPALSSGLLGPTGITLRQANKTSVTASTSVSIPAPSRFGTNAAYPQPYSQRRVFGNLLQGGYWQNPADGYNFAGYQSTAIDSNFQPITKGLWYQLPHGDVSGQQLELTYDTGSGLSVSTRNTEGDAAYSGLTSVDAHTLRVTETFTYGSGHTFGSMSFDDWTSPPKHIDLRPVGESKSKLLADSYVTFCQKTHGPLRFLDWGAGNYGSWGNQWADRSLPSMANWLGHPQGIPIEFMIALCNAANRDMYLPIAGYATDDYYTKLFEAIDTGAHTINGVALNTNLKIYVEWKNEVWNPQFLIYNELQTRYVARTGETALTPSAGGTEQRLREQAYQHVHAMTLLEAAIPTYATRCVRVLGTQTSGDYPYNIMRAEAGVLAHTDAVCNAPYFQVIWTSGDSTAPADLVGPWTAAAVQRIDDLVATRTTVHADNKRFILYEGGADFAASGMPAAAAAAFKASPQFGAVMNAHFSRHATKIGDVYCHFTDTGGDASSVYNWGLESYQGDPNDYAMQALLAVQAVVEAG